MLYWIIFAILVSLWAGEIVYLILNARLKRYQAHRQNMRRIRSYTY